MHRVLALVASLALALGLFAPISAQDAGPTIGDPVPVVGPEGTEVAVITVDDLSDPFEDYDPGSPPERGSHFVLVTMTVENTGSRPLSFDPNAVALQDADGFVYSPSRVFRGDEPDPPDLVF